MKSTNFSSRAGRFGLPYLILCFLSCSKDNDANSSTASSPTPTSDSSRTTDQFLKPYSGTWKGTFKAVDVLDRNNHSSCVFNPGSVAVQQDWQVRPDSTVKVYELLYDSGAYPSKHYWAGLIHHKDSISLTSAKIVTCSGDTSTLPLHIIGRITRDRSNQLQLSTTLEYPLCPQSCVYTFNYSLSKK